MLSTSQFRFANWECLQLFATGNKKPVREVDRIPSSRTVKLQGNKHIGAEGRQPTSPQTELQKREDFQLQLKIHVNFLTS